MNLPRLRDLLNLSAVPRWVVVPHHGHQSVAEHSFRVAAIAAELAIAYPHGSSALATLCKTWALAHDGSEAITGDVPGSYKSTLTPNERERINQAAPWCATEGSYTPPLARQIVKLADLIESFTFIQRFGVPPRSIRIAQELNTEARVLAEELKLSEALESITHLILD